MTQRIAYCRIENGEVAAQAVFPEGQTPDGEDWRPVVVELEDYNHATHQEVARANRVEANRVVRYLVIEPIPLTPEMVKAECQRRIIAYTGGGDVIGSLAKQINAGGTMQPEIDRLRSKSNEIEAMDPIPMDFRSDTYWAA